MDREHLAVFFVSPECMLADAMQKIDINGNGILFVLEENKKLIGVLSDGDIRRWIIKTGELKTQVGQVMNKEPRVLHKDERLKAKRYLNQYGITALPVVDEEGVVEDIIFKGSKQESTISRKTMESIPVVIMAGGKGTRLYPYTKILPKPLIPIGDIPIMERIMNKFREFGIREFFVTVNYRKSMIKAYFQENPQDYKIRYVEEDIPLGTAGSLTLIEKGFEKAFIVTNCDILIHENYEAIYKYHKDSGNEITVVSALKNTVVPYGVIHSSKNGTVCSIEEKPKMSHFINTGMYILNPELINDIPYGAFYHMTDLMDKLLKENRKVGMYPISEDSFLDMGEFEEMRRMEEKLSLKTE